MRIEQLTFFMEVAKTGSINKAAENLYVTQPGLSDSIKKMESELDLTLLNRSKTGVSLTENGKIVAQHANTILRTYTKMMQDLSMISPKHDDPQQTITIATSPLFAASILRDVIEAFNQQYPDTTIRCIEANFQDMFQCMKKKECDLGFFNSFNNDAKSLSTLPSHLTCTKLFNDDLIVCHARKSRYALKKTFSHNIIRTAKLVQFATINFPAYQNVIAVSNDIATQIDILLKGHCVTIIPKFSFHRCFAENKNLMISTISPPLSTSFYMLYRNNDEKNYGLEIFIDFFRNYLNTSMLTVDMDEI